MNVQVAVLCDAATQDNSSKLNLLGAFDTIYAPQCRPCIRNAPWRCASLSPPATRASTNSRSISSTPTATRSCRPWKSRWPLCCPTTRISCHLNFVVNIQQLQFPEAGLYSVDVRLDGKSQASIPLQVKLIPRPAA